MSTIRVDVWPKAPEPETDLRSRLYFLEGENLERTEVEKLAREVLVDPVTEQFIIDAGDDSGVYPAGDFVEITFLSGVTDSAAENLLRVAKLLEIQSLTRAATGERVQPVESIGLEALTRLASEEFSNPVVQRFSVNASITAPFFNANLVDSGPLVEMISIRDADDKRLLEISRDRRLALDLAEMQAVRAYYVSESCDASDIELEMIAQTWSEHCVHKTFRAVITTPDGSSLEGMLKSYLMAATNRINKPWVRSAFIDNAGIIEFDDEFDIAIKVETHNHPSALEPFGGANTGVGGVVRDILAVGARPIANTDVLCFGPLEREDVPEGVLHPKRVMAGVVRGIEDYGNKMGIPTVNGAILHHEGYTSNPLVFCGCVGILPASPKNAKPPKARAGDFIIAIGGKTGRDGLRGATFSSLEMDTSTTDIAGSSVQIGNPIVEKQTQEAILRLKAEGLYSALTDCGAGGFSSAVGEMSEGLGAKVHLERAPLKYPGLKPWEIWLSEAQERMVFAVPAENLGRFGAICAEQDLEAIVLGQFTDSGRLELWYHADLVGELALGLLHDGIPRKHLQADAPAAKSLAIEIPESDDLELDLLNLLAHPNICSKENTIRVFDHEVKGGTAVKPLVGVANHGPSDAAVIVPNPNAKSSSGPLRAIAISNGICPQFSSEPYTMAWAAIDEAVRNAVAVGADPDRIAILDNFCWGNPSLPDRLGGLLETARGCHDAAIAYGTPFVSGKDSLYNEYTDETGQKHAIPGTLLISAVGIVPDVLKTVTMDFKAAENFVYLLGETRNELGSSHYAMNAGLPGGAIPQPFENPLERYQALHRAISGGLVQSAHDCSEGGLAVALAEMSLAGRLGLSVLLESVPVEIGSVESGSVESGSVESGSVESGSVESGSVESGPVESGPVESGPVESGPVGLGDTATLFSESVGRIVLEVAPWHAQAFEAALKDQPFARIGMVLEDERFRIKRDGELILETDIEALERAWRGDLAPTPAPVAEQSASNPSERASEKSASGKSASGKSSTAKNLSGKNPSAKKVLVLHANGSNRDHDASLAIELSGGTPEIVHVNQLADGSRKLEDYAMLVLPGGFSYGDDLGAGVLWALDLRERFDEQLRRFVSSGRPVMGICNGFQTLVKAGVLPGDLEQYNAAQARTSTLTFNQQGHFECRWVTLEPNQNSVSIFTKGLEFAIDTPIAHGEGRFVCDDATLEGLQSRGMIALTYSGSEYPANPNGSVFNIAGVSNAAGNVLGLMPHPENHVFDWQHPRWHRGEKGSTGLVLFQNALRYAK
jgi:phosphoribosylformylglycinamidine synthase II/phosphoribosylformylglycinamidine synthase I